LIIQKYIKSKCTALKYTALVCIASLAPKQGHQKLPLPTISEEREKLKLTA
jgi:hypothetical protein